MVWRWCIGRGGGAVGAGAARLSARVTSVAGCCQVTLETSQRTAAALAGRGDACAQLLCCSCGTAGATVPLFPKHLRSTPPHLACCQLSSTSSSYSNSTSKAPTRLSLLLPFASRPAPSPGSLVLWSDSGAAGAQCNQGHDCRWRLRGGRVCWCHTTLLLRAISRAPVPQPHHTRLADCCCSSWHPYLTGRGTMSS